MYEDLRKETTLVTTDEYVSGMPTLECTHCHFQADHFFFYDSASYADRAVMECPSCGCRILGVVVKSGRSQGGSMA